MSDLLTKIKSLPDAPGVYLFYSASGELIYVGRATSLKNRVKSYFQKWPPLLTKEGMGEGAISAGKGRQTPPSLPSERGGSRPIEEMVHEITRVEHKETDSVLESVILESIYIKKFLPKYNVMGKDNKSWNYIAITKDAYPRIEPIRQYDIKVAELSGINLKKKYSHLFGPYPSLNMRAAQKILRRIFNYSVCKPGSPRPCIYYEMGQCLGVCIGTITPAEYKKQVIRPLTWFLAGKKKAVIKEFERQMKIAAKEERFEEAAHLRNHLGELNHIHDMTLIDRSWFEDSEDSPRCPSGGRGGLAVNRIEGYDISNLGATDKVGSMVVFDSRAPVKSQYRKFKIKTVVGQSDVDSLAEVLNRRLNHPEWPMPDVVLIDGGRPQVNRIKKVFKERGVSIPFVGIAKGRERKHNDFILGSTEPAFVIWSSKHRGLLIRVRDEAHRFAITFNRSKRKIK